MERLTRHVKFRDDDCYEALGFGAIQQRPFFQIIKKLAKYEDAEEQGLLLRLPVAIGQTVYTNHSMQGWYCRSSNRPYEAEVVYIGLNNCEESGGGYINISFKGKKGCMLSFAFKEIGITWFLTKEEAEQAIKQMGE